MKTFIVKTIGCKANQYDGQVIRESLRDRGYRDWRNGDCKADVCVINTCTVTRSSDAKSRRAVRRAVRENPGAVVIVTGCCAESSPRDLASLEGVDHVVGNGAKGRIAGLVPGDGDGAARAISGFAGHTRAFVKIQDGCDSACSYCIVPRVRGRSRSRRQDEIVREVKSLASGGYREIVLSGIHLGAYGADRGERLALERLIGSLRHIRGIARVRLSSIEPNEVSDELIGIMASGGPLCPHLHIPLQSGDGRVLGDMRRGYTPSGFRRLVERLRRTIPDVSLTTDVMVGFPTETEGAFRKTIDMVRAACFSRVHIFPYSPRQGTQALRLGDPVPRGEKGRRRAELEIVAAETAAAYRKRFLGRPVEVLVQSRGEWENGRSRGISREYLRVYVAGRPASPGEIRTAVVQRLLPDGLAARSSDAPAGSATAGQDKRK